MPKLKAICVLTTLAMGLAAGGTFGEEYRDPDGFSFTYPKGWIALTGETKDGLREELTPETRTWLEKNAIDLNKISLLLVRNGKAEFLENLNVVVIKQQITPDEETLKSLLEQMEKQYEKMGMKIKDVVSRVEKVGANKALVVEYRARLPIVPDELKQKQVFIPGGGKTYIITCTGRADTYADHAATFDKMLTSVTVPRSAR